MTFREDAIPEDNQPGHHPEHEQDKPEGPPEALRFRPRAVKDARDELPLTFPFAFDPRLIGLSLVNGAWPGRAQVVLSRDSLDIRYGFWTMRVPTARITGAEVTGPYAWWKVAGPPHFSFADHGITFAASAARGACIRFDEPLPFGPIKVPGVTVAVREPDELVRHIDALSRG